MLFGANQNQDECWYSDDLLPPIMKYNNDYGYDDVTLEHHSDRHRRYTSRDVFVPDSEKPHRDSARVVSVRR